MKLTKKLFYIFSVKQRWQFAGLFLLQLVETCLDFLSISLILPFVNVLVSAGSMQDSWWYPLITGLLRTSSTTSVSPAWTRSTTQVSRWSCMTSRETALTALSTAASWVRTSPQ